MPRIYAKEEGRDAATVRAFESKDELAVYVSKVSVAGKDLLNKEGKAFKTYSVDDYIKHLVEASVGVDVSVLTAKQFAVESGLSPAARKRRSVSVSWNKY
jgi:hypothetical protein